MSQHPIPFSSPSGSSGPAGATRRFPKRSVITFGVVVGLIGLALIIWPFFSASWILVVLFGSALIANGAVLIARGRGSLGGILLIVAGVVAMAFTGATARALVSFAAFGLIAIGALWLFAGARFARSKPSIGIVPGAVLLVGGILARIWPGVALSIAAIVGGIVILAIATFIVWGATRARRVDASAATIVI